MKPLITAEVDVENEEIVIHPTAIRIGEDGNWLIDARIIGCVKIEGKTYEFNNVIEIELADPL